MNREQDKCDALRNMRRQIAERDKLSMPNPLDDRTEVMIIDNLYMKLRPSCWKYSGMQHIYCEMNVGTEVMMRL